ncbi:hypothetical protein M0L20_27420, partial [Spirosoma sp. RP8]
PIKTDRYLVSLRINAVPETEPTYRQFYMTLDQMLTDCSQKIRWLLKTLRFSDSTSSVMI